MNIVIWKLLDVDMQTLTIFNPQDTTEKLVNISLLYFFWTVVLGSLKKISPHLPEKNKLN